MVEQQAWRNCQRTLLESLIFLYIAVSKKVIAMAICVEVGEVNHVLADPAMTCMDETHLPARLLSFFVILLGLFRELLGTQWRWNRQT